MSATPRQSIVTGADVTRFLIAFGIAPLVLATASVAYVANGLTGGGPWAFALMPGWSIGQLVVMAVAGVALGISADRPAHGLAAVTLGVLLGLAVDVWWLAGFVEPFDQAFVTMLPQDAWRSDMIRAALAMFGLVTAGFAIGVVVGRYLERPSGSRTRPRPTGSEGAALGVALIIGPLLAVAIASAAASSALVVPDGAQVQTVVVSRAAITVDPAVLRPGQWRFRCHFGADAAPEWARLVAVPEGVEPGAFAPTSDNEYSWCGQTPGRSSWGVIGDLQPGRYMWIQNEQTENPRILLRSRAFVVTP